MCMGSGLKRYLKFAVFEHSFFKLPAEFHVTRDVQNWQIGKKDIFFL